jgi:hypothetical protein
MSNVYESTLIEQPVFKRIGSNDKDHTVSLGTYPGTIQEVLYRSKGGFLPSNAGSSFFTLILKNEQRDALLYLGVSSVFKVSRLVGQALQMGPWTRIEISKG